MTLKNAIEIYLDWKTTHAQYAASQYAVRLNQFLGYLGEDTLLANITGDDVIRYHRHLENSHYYDNGIISKKYSLSTVAYSTIILKNFFRFWQGRGKAFVNHKELLTVRHIVPLKKTVSYEEFRKMSESLSVEYFDELIKKLIIHLLWDTGMRLSELKEMNISDIHEVHPEYGVRSATIRTRKTMRYSLVAWSAETNDLLNKYLGIRLCMDIPTDALLVTGIRKKAKSITSKTIERWVKIIANEANITGNITPHSFRHGKAHHMLKNKANITEIAAILRHSKLESCYHYLQMNPEQYLKTASKFLNSTQQNLLLVQ